MTATRFFVLCALSMALAPACECNPSLVDPPGDGFLNVYLQVEQGDFDRTVTALTLDVIRFEVAHTDLETGEESIITIVEGELEVVAARAADGIPLLIFEAVVPAGEIRQVRFVLTGARIATVDGIDELALFEVTEAKVPSGPQTGIKLVPRETFVLEELETQSLVGILDLGRSVVDNRSKLILKPVVPAEELLRPTVHDALTPDEALVLVNVREFSETGVRLERAVAVDTVTLLSRDITLNAQTGEPASFEQERQANELAWRSRYGALHHAFVDELAMSGPTEELEAFVWVAVPPLAPFETTATTPPLRDEDHTLYLAARRAAVQPILSDAADALEGAGAEIVAISYHPPTIHVRATRPVFENTLAFLPAMTMIVGSGEDLPLLGDDAATDLIEEPLFFAHLFFGAGADLRIAIGETGSCIASDHPAFRFVVLEPSLGFSITEDNPFGRCDEVVLVGDHSTRVASMAASVRDRRLSKPRGVRPIGLFQGRMFEFGFAISDALLERNPHFINRSQLIGPAVQPEMDYAVHLSRVFIINAAGQGSDEPPVVSCYSYNSLCIGGYVHHDTLGVIPGVGTNFGDDTAAGWFLNDPGTGREEPDMAGIFSPRTARFGVDSIPGPAPDSFDAGLTGTSFSSPSVLGLAALLTANFESVLLNEPTLLRGVLHASAEHSVRRFEGAPRISVALFGDGVDDSSGSGVPRGDRAIEILENEQFFHGYLDRNVDFLPGGLLATPLVFEANVGDVVRVAVVWDQCTDGMLGMDDTMLVDLNMVVVGPTGGSSQQVKVNQSNVDNREVIRFIALNSGTHRINVQAMRWEQCPLDPPGTLKAYVAVVWDTLPLFP